MSTYENLKNEPIAETSKLKIVKTTKKVMAVVTNNLKVLKIQRTCVHDGPGIRTVIFFNGCSLKCLWCQNPEAISFKPDSIKNKMYSVNEIMQVVKKDKEYYFASNGGVTLSGGEPLMQHPDSLLHLLKLCCKIVSLFFQVIYIIKKIRQIYNRNKK